jgi:putative oxidoreductase
MDLGLLLLRLTVGLTVAAHGAQKLFGWFGGAGLDGARDEMAALGFHPPRRFAAMAGAAQAGGGLLVALGLLTPLGATLIVAVMFVAVATHARHGFFHMRGGFEYAFVLGMGGLTLAFTGPGALSIDRVAGYSPGGAMWGVAVLLVALAGGGMALLSRQHARSGPG